MLPPDHSYLTVLKDSLEQLNPQCTKLFETIALFETIEKQRSEQGLKAQLNHNQPYSDYDYRITGIETMVNQTVVLPIRTLEKILPILMEDNVMDQISTVITQEEMLQLNLTINKHIKTLQQKIKELEEKKENNIDGPSYYIINILLQQLDKLSNYMRKAVNRCKYIYKSGTERELGKILNLLAYDVLNALLQPVITDSDTYKVIDSQLNKIDYLIDKAATLLALNVHTFNEAQKHELVNTMEQILKIINGCEEIVNTAQKTLEQTNDSEQRLNGMKAIIEMLRQNFDKKIYQKFFQQLIVKHVPTKPSALKATPYDRGYKTPSTTATLPSGKVLFTPVPPPPTQLRHKGTK